MSDLIVLPHADGVLVVDSRLIAEELGIQHESFMETVEKYRKQSEQAFGTIRFETGSSQMPDGRINPKPQKFALLTEEQATFYMTLSRNTPEVVQLKVRLVKAFFDARERFRGQGFAERQTTTVYIQRLQNMSDHDVPFDVWTTFREGAEVLLMVEKDFRLPVSQMDLCDGSIGSHWVKHREEIGLPPPTRKYVHKFRDHRPNVTPNAFEYPELPIFRQWLKEIYIPKHLPKYLTDKYGKRAALQVYVEQKQLNEHILELTKEKGKAPKQEELYQIFLAARDAMSPSRYLPS
jgi:phage regulator Rha-like protein